MDDRRGTLEPGKLAGVLVDDLAKVDLVIGGRYPVAQGGKVTIPRHSPEPRPGKAAAPAGANNRCIIRTIGDVFG